MKYVIRIILLQVLMVFAVHFSFGQNINPFYETVVSELSKDSLVNDLEFIESTGNRTYWSDEIRVALEWLKESHMDFGYTNIEVDTFSIYGDEADNLVINKTGTKFPNTYLIVCAHYDGVGGPGVNDNGTGVSIIMEIARLLVDIETNYSIKFIYFSGEEAGLYGSYHYVQDIAVPINMDIKLVLNIDMVGGVNGLINDTVMCIRDEEPPFQSNPASLAYTDTLATLIKMYSNLETEIGNNLGSDYYPFQEENYVITGLSQHTHSPYVHSPADTLGNLDTEYVYQVAKGSTAAVLYFSGAYDESSSIVMHTNNKIVLAPNPAHLKLTIKTQLKGYLTIKNLSGQELYTTHIKGPTTIDVSTLPEGVYILKLFGENGVQTAKFIKK